MMEAAEGVDLAVGPDETAYWCSGCRRSYPWPPHPIIRQCDVKGCPVIRQLRTEAYLRLKAAMGISDDADRRRGGEAVGENR